MKNSKASLSSEKIFFLLLLLLGAVLCFVGERLEPSSDMRLYNRVFFEQWGDDSLGELRSTYHKMLPPTLTFKYTFLSTGILTVIAAVLSLFVLQIDRFPIKLGPIGFFLLALVCVGIPQVSWLVGEWVHDLIANPCSNHSDVFLCEFTVYYSSEFVPAEFFKIALFILCAVVGLVLHFAPFFGNRIGLGELNRNNVVVVVGLPLLASVVISFLIGQRYSGVGIFPTLLAWQLYWWFGLGMVNEE